MKIGIICGTGPSITRDQIFLANHAKREGKALLFGGNNSIFDFDLDVHNFCNYQWADHYAEQIKDFPCDKWTTRPEVPKKFPWIRYIEERWEPGLSRDKSYICAHHGTGPQTVGLAYHYGCTRLLLIGWDMRHRAGVKRHYFGNGEYPPSMQHWTRNLGSDGELVGLIKEMETIKPQDYGIEIVNCTPGSAMKCFPIGNLKDYL